MNILGIVMVLSITAAVMVINYLIFACSKISPCYIEFDDRKKGEMRLMREYNEGFKKVFGMYVVTTIIIGLLVVASFSSFVAMVLMAVQIMYTVGAFLAMMWMYIRSVIYWERDFREQEARQIKEMISLDLVA